jgi:hypothetical protein
VLVLRVLTIASFDRPGGRLTARSGASGRRVEKLAVLGGVVRERARGRAREPVEETPPSDDELVPARREVRCEPVVAVLGA